MSEQPPTQEFDVWPGDTYEHCMGGTYRVIDFGQDATGYEETGAVTRTVVYEQLSNGKAYPAGTVWTRSLHEFINGTTEIDGELVPIFKKVV